MVKGFEWESKCPSAGIVIVFVVQGRKARIVWDECRAGSQQMAQSSQAVPMSAEQAHALQPPTQHSMIPQASSSPSLHRDSSPAPMAVQMAPSMSGDMDMDNAESSADSVIPSMSLQVGLLWAAPGCFQLWLL